MSPPHLFYVALLDLILFSMLASTTGVKVSSSVGLKAVPGAQFFSKPVISTSRAGKARFC